MRPILGLVGIFVGVFLSWGLLTVIVDALYSMNPEEGSAVYLLMMAIGFVWPVWPAISVPLCLAFLAFLERRDLEKMRKK